MTTPIDPAVEAEFDMLARRAGVEIPPDRRDVLLAGYVDIKRMAAVVRSVERSAADEPANIYSLATVTRSL